MELIAKEDQKLVSNE